MHLYSGPSIDFISDAVQNRVAVKLEQSFLDHFRFKPGPAEVRSWQQSLRAMSGALQTGGFTDHGVVLEWQRPPPSPRRPFLGAGRHPGGAAGAGVGGVKQ